MFDAFLYLHYFAAFAVIQEAVAARDKIQDFQNPLVAPSFEKSVIILKPASSQGSGAWMQKNRGDGWLEFCPIAIAILQP